MPRISAKFVSRCYRVNTEVHPGNMLRLSRTVNDLVLAEESLFHIARIAQPGQGCDLDPGLYIDLTAPEADHNRARIALHAIGFQLEAIAQESMLDNFTMPTRPERVLN